MQSRKPHGQNLAELHGRVGIDAHIAARQPDFLGTGADDLVRLASAPVDDICADT
ncbi:MAG: hypothetical protein IJ812_02275 [Schwartzia sp.]|nr:hypothetical protein [Schwartzia sp. (in: firmicutes)]MBR1885212.1 hypothetical protein [Schwartzia sp. (in: firmicutes)]